MNHSLLHRYVLREVFGPFLSTTAIFLALFYAMMLLRGVDFLLGSAAGWGDWLILGGSMLPMILQQVLPISFLLGVMIGFSRLGEDNELTAMSALGFSPRRLVRPVLLLGLGVCVVLVTIVLWLKPWGLGQMRATARDVIERNVLGDLMPGTIRADIPGIVFYSEGSAPGPTWKGVFMIDERDPARVSLLSAPQAAASLEHGVGIRFQDGMLVQRTAADEYSTTAFQDGTLLLNVEEALNRRDTFRFGPDELSPSFLLDSARQAEANGESTAYFWSLFYLRLSQMVAPLALGVLSTAVALGGRKRSARASGLLALGVYVSHYVLSRVAVQLGEKGYLAPWLAGTAATVAAAIVGVAALALVARRRVHP